MPHDRQLFPADLRGVLDKIVRVQIDHENVVVIRSQGFCDIPIGHALIRLANREDHDGNCPASCDGVVVDIAREGVDDGPVRHFLIEERAFPSMAALPDRIDEGRSVSGRCLYIVGQTRQHVDMEEPADKLLIRAVAPNISGFALLHLEDRDRDRAERVLHRTLIAAGDRTEIVQVHPADAPVVFRFPGVLIFPVRMVPRQFPNGLKGNGPSEIIPLQFGTADFLQEAHLLLGLHAFADRVQPQRRRHSHQLGQDDLPLVPLVQLPHEAHVEFQQVKADALQDIR